MKPLELTVYPLRDKVGRNARPGYIVGKRAVSTAEAHRTGIAKRLTTAELAAEYQRGEFDYERAFHGMRYLSGNWNPDKFATHERRAVLECFATLPHYDEDQS